MKLDLWASCMLLLKVRSLSNEQIEQILAMTEPGQLDLKTRKRLNEAMRRRFESAEGVPLYTQPNYNAYPERPRHSICARTQTGSSRKMESDQGSDRKVQALYHTIQPTFSPLSHFTVLLRFAFLKAFLVHKDMNDLEVETFYVETTSCNSHVYIACRVAGECSN